MRQNDIILAISDKIKTLAKSLIGHRYQRIPTEEPPKIPTINIKHDSLYCRIIKFKEMERHKNSGDKNPKNKFDLDDLYERIKKHKEKEASELLKQKRIQKYVDSEIQMIEEGLRQIREDNTDANTIDARSEPPVPPTVNRYSILGSFTKKLIDSLNKETSSHFK